jgi:hypothetical protein
VLGFFLLVIVLPSLVGHSTDSGQDELTVESVDWGYGEYRNISGTVRNNTDKEFGYVEVDFSLYDESGVQVGDAMTNLTHMDPHGTWQFKAPVLESRARTFKLKGVYTR